MDDFSTYAQMRREGVSALDAYLYAKENGLDALKRIRIKRRQNAGKCQ
jgi:hypothetical protein